MDKTEIVLRYWNKISLIPFVVIGGSGKLVYASKNIEGTDLGELLKTVKHTRKETTENPGIEIVSRNFAYAFFYDKEDNYYVIGPITIGEVRNVELKGFALSSIAWFDVTQDIHRDSLTRLEAQAQLMYCSLTGNIQMNPVFELNEQEDDEYNLMQYQFENIDNEVQRNTYEEILPLIDAVRHGNIEEFQRIYDSTLVDRTGKLAAAPLKKSEYLTVKIISLAMHAMIDGGVDYQIAYDTSDLYLQKLERCTNIMQMRKLQMDYVHLAIEMVHNLVHEDYDVVEEVKKYVVSHRNKHFSITQMSEELHVNASYLSRAFSKKENMTIQQFISQERIKAACNMLAYSAYSVTEIASYLCFSSQSHFSHQFKKVIGVTPSQYRKNKLTRQDNKTLIHG